MKRRGSLFRRKTDVSSALLWIEECMLNTKWWIHVQSSSEEGRPIAATPTDLFPSLQFIEENEGYFPFGSVASPACGGLLEIVSPTAEDHILECAILFRRIRNDRQLVLLSNDVPLKIKAMAEVRTTRTIFNFLSIFVLISLFEYYAERILLKQTRIRILYVLDTDKFLVHLDMYQYAFSTYLAILPSFWLAQ